MDLRLNKMINSGGYIGEVIVKGEMEFTVLNIVNRLPHGFYNNFEIPLNIIDKLIVCKKKVKNKELVVTLTESVLLGLERYSEFDSVREK
jgi:hypothetical protein